MSSPEDVELMRAKLAFGPITSCEHVPEFNIAPGLLCDHCKHCGLWIEQEGGTWNAQSY